MQSQLHICQHFTILRQVKSYLKCVFETGAVLLSKMLVVFCLKSLISLSSSLCVHLTPVPGRSWCMWLHWSPQCKHTALLTPCENPAKLKGHSAVPRRALPNSLVPSFCSVEFLCVCCVPLMTISCVWWEQALPLNLISEDRSKYLFELCW